MKKYIRDMINDLRRKKGNDQAPPAALPGDLNNQILSKDPMERVRQLDFQAQQDEER